VLRSSGAKSSVTGCVAPAAERGRCYDVRCQALAVTLWRSACGVVPCVPGKRRRQSPPTVEPAALRGVMPPDGQPSGAGLPRGARGPRGLVTPARVAPQRGGGRCLWTVHTAPVHTVSMRGALTSGHGRDGVTVTGGALAPMPPTSARARATPTWVAWVPRAMQRRVRGHRRTGAGHRRAWCAARQLRPWDRLPTGGGHAGAGRLGAQGWRDDPAALALCGQLARAPRPTRSRCRDDDQGWGVGWPRAPAWSQVAWPRPHGATGDDRSGVRGGAIGHRAGVRVDRQTARARARRGQG
jgi:hypothetical protein